MNVKVTFYGYPDNDDGSGNFGTNVIAHELTWQGHNRRTNEQGDPIAGGAGTFEDPITAAASEGNTLMPPGTLVYIPRLKKYFLLEDNCASCSTEAWIDLWMESNAQSNPDVVLECEDNWTGDDTQLREIWINPPTALEVDTTPFFDTNLNRCNAVRW
jgi:hypothetical protein